MKWSEEEIELLREIYPNNKTSDILSYFPGRGEVSIKLKANNLKIKKLRNHHVEGDLSVLLEETPISYYWMGFVMADGSLSENYRLRFALAEKDGEQVRKFAEFIKCKNTCKYYHNENEYPFLSVSVQDKYYGEKIRKKFDIIHNKTYDPPLLDFTKWDENLFLAFLIGFIDGDGSIQKQTYREDCIIKFKNHGSWFNTLQIFSDIVCKNIGLKSNIVIIDKSGYACFTFTNLKICRYLKNAVNRLNLPVLQRKWGLIDENRLTKEEKTIAKQRIILDFEPKGLSIRKMSEQTKISRPYIYKILKEKNNE